MPGVSHGFTLPPTTLQSSNNLRLSMECGSMKATPGKQLKLDSSKNSSVTGKGQHDISKVQLGDQLPAADFAENKPKSSSSVLSGGKVCKSRHSVLSSCSQHGQPPEHNSAVSKQKTLHTCTSCSSTEVIEVNIKLKSCQNCQNVVIDELNYDNQPVDEIDGSREKRKNSNSSNASTSGGGSLNFYHQQLMVITKKLKNMYKNRIHSSYTDDQQERPQNNGTVQSPVPPTPITEPAEIFATPHGPSTSSMISPVDRRPVRSVASQNSSVKFSNSICNNHCYGNNLPTDDRDCSTSKTSSISTLPFKSSSNYNSNVVNKDALILRICDLDDNLKSMRNDSNIPMNKTTCINGNRVEGNTSSLKTLKNSNVDCEGNIKKVSPKLVQASQRNNRKIVIISNEYKNKSGKNDVHIRDRKELIKLFQQNKSKSLDLLPPSKNSNKFSSRKETQDQVFSSQSVMNLPKQESVDDVKNAGSRSDDDDDDGPYESINSVELIFISDEFLNKAVKHDLKILKSKQTATENSIRPTSLKKKVRTLEATTSPIKTLKPEDCYVDNPQTPSSISPDNYQVTAQRATISRPSLTGSKKLIVISEDFKRKSLENNVVIVDACTNDSNSIGEAIDKRKKFQQTKRFSRQQSSIDDVANQMISHAFRSFEEPDEQCLESKELKTPE